MRFPPAPNAARGSVSPGDGPPPDVEYAETADKAHGRVEVRRLALSREVASHLGWPGAAHVCRIEWIRERAGKKSGRKVSCFVTGPARSRAGPAALLALVRRRRSIETRLHYRRDTALREDASRVRAGNAPQALAALRNTVLRRVRSLRGPLAAIRETFAENRLEAIAAAKDGVLRNALLRRSRGNACSARCVTMGCHAADARCEL